MKKTLLLVLFLVMSLISVGTVSAQEINSGDTAWVAAAAELILGFWEVGI